MPVRNEDIAARFEEIADLLALEGKNAFRIRAYRRGAQTVRSLSGELHERVACGFDPETLPGIGAELAAKIRELVDTGKLKALDKLRKSAPVGLRDLLAVPNIGPQRARALFKALKIHNLEELRTALAAKSVRTVPGFGAKLEARLGRALGAVDTHEQRLLRSTAAQYGIALKTYLESVDGVSQVEIAGSFRRGRDTVGDLDILVCAPVNADVAKALRSYDETASILVSGTTRTSIKLRNDLQVDVRVVAEESFGAALYYFTGSKAHNIHLRRIAKSRGLKINEYGVFRSSRAIAGKTEREVLRCIGLPYIAPELREDRGEIEAAADGRLPKLIERPDLHGDLHVHTKASDGTATISAMANAAHRAGLEYIAITDHSKHIGVVHGLDISALAKQIDAIDENNARNKGCTVLAGTEVDILEDGSLALPDSILKRLDIVVAALHDHFRLTRRKQTDRLLRTLDRDHLTIIAHPTARLIQQRAEIDCDWAKVFERAAQRPCFMELNSQPMRLDLNDVRLRDAAANGVLISIATDAHRTDDFANLDYGITQARRGWLTAKQVVNTRSLTALRKLLGQRLK